MTRMLAATAAWLRGVAEAEAEAEIETAVEDMLGVTVALEDRGTEEIAEDEITEDEATDETADVETAEDDKGVEEAADEETAEEVTEEDKGTDETAEEETALETGDEEAGLDEAGLLDTGEEAEALPEGETAELEAGLEGVEVPRGLEEGETVTMTELEAEPDGMEPEEEAVMNVEGAGALLVGTMDDPPRDEDKDTDPVGVNEGVELTTTELVTPTELLGVLEGVEVGGW